MFQHLVVVCGFVMIDLTQSQSIHTTFFTSDDRPFLEHHGTFLFCHVGTFKAVGGTKTTTNNRGRIEALESGSKRRKVFFFLCVVGTEFH